MKKLSAVILIAVALLLCGCGEQQSGLKYTSGQCINCEVVTERAVEYDGMIFCEACYREALPSICDLCGENADDGEEHNGILYCAGCFDEYCDENDVHQCTNCNEFKKECINRGTDGIPVWVCEECNAGDTFEGESVLEQTS